jgi:flagellin-like hook-associated protein FlgL
MPVSINSNLASVRGQRAMGNASEQLNRTFEKLSSGQRINRAADDADKTDYTRAGVRYTGSNRLHA